MDQKIKKSWIKNPDAPVTDGQQRFIRAMLKSKNLSEYWLMQGIKKYIKQLTMGEANIVINKLSKIKSKK